MDDPGSPGPLIHAYYGFGRGKTSAAVGTALRAAGAGKRVAIIQFDKGFTGEDEHYSERRVLRTIPGIDLFPTGCERLLPDGSFRFGYTPEDRHEKERGLELARRLLAENRHFLIILDEILDTGSSGLIEETELLELIRICRDRFTGDLVLTGHSLPPAVEPHCDLITHFQKVKHYYDRGVTARRGIEI